MYRNVGWLNNNMMRHLEYISKKLASPCALVLTEQDIGMLATIKRRNACFQQAGSPIFVQKGVPGCHA
jgi:hypothetical protein